MDFFSHKFARFVFLFSVATSVFVLCFSFYFSIFFGRNALAQDPSTSSAFRAAETALNAFLVEVKDPSKKDKLISTLGACSNGLVEGKNAFGRYKVEFFNESSVPLSCSEKISQVYFLRVTGSVDSRSWVLASGIIKGGMTAFRCTGDRPVNTEIFSNDDFGLSSDVSWKYSEKDTSRKCEYKCRNNFSWDGSICKSNESTPSTTTTASSTYVTVGNENQTKTGSLGVNGAFSAFGGIDAGGNRIQDVAPPTDASDAVNKAYVDELIKASFP